MRHLKIVLCLAAAACAKSAATPDATNPSASEASQTAPKPAAHRRQRDLLLHDEILESPQRDLDLFQAIRALRPQFLVVPPGIPRASAEPVIAVYIGRVRQNGLESLRTLLASNVEEVRYLDPVTSQNQFGPAASAGALLIKMHTKMDPH
jgi:hypothetical protein